MRLSHSYFPEFRIEQHRDDHREDVPQFMIEKRTFCKMKNLECFTMTAGFGNSAKFEDPNLERQADDRLAPFNEITRETVEWTKGTIAGRNQPYDKWIKQLKQFDKTSKCGRVWGSDYIAYRLEMF